MIIHFIPAHKTVFSYVEAKDFDIKELPENPTRFKEGFLDIAFAFDIETTSYHSDKYDTDLATMYIWQVHLGGYVILGRTWDEFLNLLEEVNRYCEEKGGNLLCLDHNLGFEFSFIKGIIPWSYNEDGYPDIFAKDSRTVLKARYEHIEFRDTLALTDRGLASLPKNYGLDTIKLVGDLDYSLYRHSKSKLTFEELAYCINDVQILAEFFHKYLVPNFLELGIRIPLTATGEVRMDIRNNFSKLTKEEKKKARSRIRNSMPSQEIYELWRAWLFRGGFVHANVVACNCLLERPGEGRDLKSAHPTHALIDKFPYRFNRVNNNNFDKVLKEARKGDYAFFGIFNFYGIHTSTCHALESKNKIIDASSDAVFENGRLVCASYMKVCLMELDYFNYEDLYVWDKVEVCTLYQAAKYPLPDYLRKTVMTYFEKKNTIPSSDPNYSHAKRRLNSTFGCCATSLPVKDLYFNPDTNDFEETPGKRTYEELTRWLLLLPQWAIWIAAGTRRDIVRGIKASADINGGYDIIYYDTDSLKFINPEDHEEWFKQFNEERAKEVAAMETYDFDPKHFEKLGSFEFEYSFQKAKVLGCKRYVITHDNVTQVTVAGMVKGSLEEYCAKTGKDVYEEFRNDLELSPEYSKKKTSVYCDEYFEDTLTDYQGVTAKVSEHSCVAIVPIPFTMNVEEAFLKRIRDKMEDRKRMLYDGVL